MAAIINDHKVGGSQQNLFSHSFGGQGLKLRCQKSQVPTKCARGTIFSCPFLLLDAAGLPWLVVTQLQFLTLSLTDFFNSPIYLPRVFLIRTLITGFSIYPDNSQSPHFKILNLLIYLQRLFFFFYFQMRLFSSVWGQDANIIF